jgi:hypothetical protein
VAFLDHGDEGAEAAKVDQVHTFKVSQNAD